VDFTPNITDKVLISCNLSNGCLVLDGSTSSDAESPLSALTFQWYVRPSPIPFSTSMITSNCLDFGTQTIDRVVTDPQGAHGSASLVVEVITVQDAIEELIQRVNDSNIARKNKRPFIATLKAAAASADRDHRRHDNGQQH